MFHKTSTKLVGLYLAIIMMVSLFFSVNVYQLSVQEFDKGFRGQNTIIRRGPDFRSDPFTRDDLIRDQESHYKEAKTRVLNRLILVNIFILVGGGFLSYYLARRTLKPIEEAHQALEQFTADASHELRTPLAAMQTETEVTLLNPKLNLKQAEDQLKSNLEELGKLTALSEGLLRLAQLDNQRAANGKVDLDTLIQKAINRTQPMAQKKNVRIQTEGVTSLHALGDADNLTEALVTILDNAIKYSPARSEIKVQAAKESHLANVHITDQGIGIKADELPHIFERFYRADSSRSKQNVGGYGLGLAIAKNIIEQNGGQIKVASQPSNGSTFTISLQLAR